MRKSVLKNFLQSYLDPESKLLVKNSNWVFMANVIVVASIFAQSVILGRLLGAILYGQYVLIIAFVETIQQFLNPNVDVALVKFVAEYKSQGASNKVAAFVKGSYLVTAIAAFASTIVTGVIVFLPFSIFPIQHGLKVYILAFAAGKSVSFFDNISTSLLRVYERFRLNSVIRISLTLLELTIISLVANFDSRQISMLFLALATTNVIAAVIRNVAALLECREILESHWHDKLNVLKEQWKEIRDFVMSNLGSRFIKVLYSRGDILVLGAFSVPEQIAYYSIAKKLAYSILLITDPMYASIYPQLASLISQRRYHDVKIMLKKISKILFIPLALFVMIALVFNKWLLIFIYGSEYGAAGKPFLFLILAVCFGAEFFWLTPLLLSLGKAVFRLKIDIIVFIVGAMIALLLAPSYGAVGVAIGMLAIYSISHSIFLYVSTQKLK